MPEREPLPRQAYTLVPVPARESRPRTVKATTYYPLKRALIAVANEPATTDKSCFITLIVNVESSEPYKPQTYRQAVSRGNTK